MPVAPLEIPENVRLFLETWRVGRLAVVDENAIPALVPICYQLQGGAIISVVDDVPENVEPLRMRQVEIIKTHPNMSVIVDRWEEDWKKLGWVLMRGIGEILDAPGEEQRKALSALRDKYSQYRGINLRSQPVIRMNILSIRHWGNLSLTGE